MSSISEILMDHLNRGRTMRNITEALLEVEDIINYNLVTLHKLVEIANTISKDKPDEQAAIAKTIGCIWYYLKPVHIWIRQLDPTQIELYDKLDKYLEESAKRSLEVKSLHVSENVSAIPRRKGKK